MTIGLDLAVDGLAGVMLGLIVVAGIPVLAHARRSVAAEHRRRVQGLLVAFAAAMAVLVTADDLLLLYLAWEITSVVSFLLIGTTHTAAYAREAARRALFVTGGGGLALLVAILVLVQSTGERTLSGVLGAGIQGTEGVVVAALVLLAVATKSAQWPLHRWLPGAMAAPAPVSAFLHSATMVKAGVYLALRISPLLAGVALWDTAIVVVSAVSLLLGGWRALRAEDLKALFAWSTISQLGMLVLVVSAPVPKALLGGAALVVAHALAKSALFLSVGTIDAATGTRRLDDLVGLGRRWPVVGVTVTIAVASLAGMAPTYGFVAKEAALAGLLSGDPVRAWVLVAGSVLSAAYAWRVATMLWGRPVTKVSIDRVPRAMVAGPVGLVGLVTVLGTIWPLGDAVANAAATSVSAKAGEAHLVLWPGLVPALGLSVLSLAAGVALATAVGRLRAPDVAPGTTPPVDVVGMLLDLPGRLGRGLELVLRPTASDRTVGILLLAAGLATLLPTLGDTGALPAVDLGGDPVVWAAMLAVLAGAGVAVVTPQRFSSVLSVGVVGFAMVGWFVRIGAPDLALTQALVETVIVLAFLLALRRAPATPSRRDATRPVALTVRGAVAVAAGLGAAALALAVSSTQRISDVGARVADRAIPDGGGRNIVNVILTDVRALDTLGEITVVGVAALGVLRLLTPDRIQTPDRPLEVR